MNNHSNSTHTASDLKRRVEELEQDLEASNERRKTADAELREYLRCAIAGHEREIQCKDKEIQSMDKDKEQLNVQNASLQRENTDLRQEVDTLQQSLSSKEDDIKKALEEARSMKKSNQTLKDLFASMGTEWEEYKSFREAKAVAEVASKKEYEQLKVENITLRAANANLSALLQSGRRDTKTLKDSIQSLREANEKLDQSNQCMQRNYGPLFCAYEQLFNGHETLRVNYSQLFDQYSVLQREQNNDNGDSSRAKIQKDESLSPYELLRVKYTDLERKFKALEDARLRSSGQMDAETFKRSIKALREANQKLDANNKSLENSLKSKEDEIQMMKNKERECCREETKKSRDKEVGIPRTHALTLVRDLEKSLKAKEDKIQMMKKVAKDRDIEAEAKRTHILNLVRDIKTYKESNKVLRESLISKEDSFKRELEESLVSNKALQEKCNDLEGECKQLESAIELGKQVTEKSRAVMSSLEKKLKSKEEKIELVKQAFRQLQVFENLLNENDEPTSKKRRVS